MPSGESVLALVHQHFARRIGRPADARRLPHFPRQLFGEVGVGFGLVAARERLKGRIGFGRQRSVLLPFQLVVQAFADHRPIAQIVGHRPDQPDVAGTERAHMRRRERKKAFRGAARFARKHYQKLTAAARS